MAEVTHGELIDRMRTAHRYWLFLVVIVAGGCGESPEPTGGPEAKPLGDLREVPAPVPVDPSELRPIIKRFEDKIVIQFGPREYDFFQKHGLEAFTDVVETEVVRHKRTGDVLGLRLSGFKDGLDPSLWGLRVGDLVISINGKPVTSRADALAQARAHDADAPAFVEIDRRGRRYRVAVVVRDPRTWRPLRPWPEPDPEKR